MSTSRMHRAIVAVAFLALLCSPAFGQSLPQGVNWLEVDGSDTLFATWTRGQQPYYAISVDGGRTVACVKEADYRIKLRHARFDPIVEVPMIQGPLAARRGGSLYLLQFMTQETEAYRNALTALGADVHQFVSQYSRIVRMDASTHAAVSSLPFVRWVGPFHSEWRVEALLANELNASIQVTRRYYVHVTAKGLVQKEAVAAHVRAMGGSVVGKLSPNGFLLTVELDSAQLLEIAHRDDVLFIDRWSAPEDDMDKARQLFGSDYVETVGGFTGQGVRAECCDGGLRTTHADFQATPVLMHTANGSSTSHGTSTYGQVFGDGASDPTARGVIPDAQGIFAAYNNLGDRYVHTGELVQAPYNAVFQTNSWGNARTFFYTTVSADMDNILFDHDFVITQSQSNAGNQDSRPQAWAKNIVSGGGIRHYDTLTTSDDAWNAGASIGPASDGRIKPDLSAFYDSIRTVSSTSDTSHTSTFGGTSGATPIIAGQIGLFFQMWAAGTFNNLPTGATVFDARAHMTTAKAMAINSASQYAFSGAGHDLTRVHQGWGRPDMQKMYDNRNRVTVIDETDVILPFSSNFYVVNVTSNDPELLVTMIFADPPGNPSAAEARINDLTLRVTSPGGTTYYGNNGLLTSNYSSSGGSANTVDTVENVLINSPQPGAWTVEVIASEINQDGHVETGALDADYALVITGANPPAPPVMDIGQPNSADASLRINGAMSMNNYPPADGFNGPFFVTLSAGQNLSMNFGSNPNYVFFLLSGDLNRNNAIFPSFGSLDIGFAPNYSDIAVVLDGANGTTFFDSLARVGAGGSQTISVPVSSQMPIGVLGTLQCAMFDENNTATLKFSAATQITIQ